MIIVDCNGPKFNIWYICEKFQEKESLWGLYPDFSYYSENILKLSPRKEILENKNYRQSMKENK